METRNCSRVLLSKQDYCSQSTTQGTNVNEILWTSSSAAETAVINSQGYFQATLVRFTQPASGLVLAEPPCWIWLQECTTNTQQDEPVNYSLFCPAPRPSSINVTACFIRICAWWAQLSISLSPSEAGLISLEVCGLNQYSLPLLKMWYRICESVLSNGCNEVVFDCGSGSQPFLSHVAPLPCQMMKCTFIHTTRHDPQT